MVFRRTNEEELAVILMHIGAWKASKKDSEEYLDSTISNNLVYI